jgi:8-amino-7-oxononanoate synthase
MYSFEQHIAERLKRIREQGLERRVLPLQVQDGARISYDDQEYLNLASNDYLGLATNQDLLQNFYAEQNGENLLHRFGPGSTASRLMTGNHPVNLELEDRLSALYAPGQALVFNSGYHLNVGILPALAGKDDLILADKLCHASLIDGMRLSRATIIRYPHLDYARLQILLDEKHKQYSQVFIVTESVFSMDGDEADLKKLVALKQQYQAVLYVDDAHGVGIRGAQGLGLGEEQQVLAQIEILVGTFGKAYGSQGAFVICSQLLRELLVNTARSFIFTTGLPPVTLSWLLFVLQRLPQMQQERDYVQELSHWLRRELSATGLVTGGSSNIIPVMIGDAGQAIQVAERLRQEGYWINAVRPPTVPAGTARLRLSLTAAMDRKELASLPERIAKAIR